MATVSYEFDSVNVQTVLSTAGFTNFRGARCDCAFCDGGSHLTVSIREDKGLYHCFRCGKGGSIRGLARQQGLHLPPPRIRKADRPKAEFRAWLSQKAREMADLEYRLYCRVRWARACLRYYPEHEGAWSALADFYNNEHRFQTFWESACDKIGQYWMYRAWRRYHRAH
jgi:hypothetical protein